MTKEDELRTALEPFANYDNWDGADDFVPPIGTKPMDYVDDARRVLGWPVDTDTQK